MNEVPWLSDELLHDITSSGQKFTPEKEEIFIQEYAEKLYSYILLEGRVRILAKSDPYLDDGYADIILNDIYATDVIGEICAIDNKQHSSIAKTLTPCVMYRFPAEEFKKLIDKHAPLREFVMLRLCDKIRDANERLRDNCVLNSSLRVTREIMRLAQLYAPFLEGGESEEGEGIFAKIPDFPKHHELASRCGVTRETVSRVLNKLIRDKIVIKDGATVIIEDMEQLGLALLPQDKF